MIIFLFLDLMSIAEWLSLNDHDEFMNVYAAVRGSVMRKSLEQVGLLFDRTRAYFGVLLYLFSSSYASRNVRN